MSRLSLSLAGLSRDASQQWCAAGGVVDARAAIGWVQSTGLRAVQLDGTLEGLRARQLDRAARRDVAAMLRRAELGLSGIDLWIPPEHFHDPARVDRAVEAAVGAIEMTGELAGLVSASRSVDDRPGIVATTLPEALAPEIRSVLEGAAERAGVRLVDHRVGSRWITPGASVGSGVDPAAVLLSGGDPSAAAASLGVALGQARLCDADPVARVGPNAAGRLDLQAYVASIDVGGSMASLVIDLRGLPSVTQRLAPAAWVSRLQRLAGPSSVLTA